MLRVLCIGKIKKHFLPAQEHYLRLLKPHLKIEIMDIKEGKSLKEEAEKIKKHVKGVLILLDEKGEEMTSYEFCKMIISTLQKGDVTVIIGGKHGVHDEIKEMATHTISFSKLTFSHQLARIILLEQLYRCVCITKNLPFAQE